MRHFFKFAAPNEREYFLFLDPAADPWQKGLSQSGAVGEPAFELLWDLARPGSMVLDLGANVGVVALRLATKGARVHAIDVLAPNLDALRIAALESWLDIPTYHAAIWNEIGEVKIHGTSAWGQVVADGSITIPSVTIDELAKSVGRIDIIKMDVEGAEKEALLGARGVLNRDHPDIVFESNVLCYGSRYSIHELMEPLYSAGYRVFRILNACISPVAPGYVQEVVCCDFLATTRTDDELRQATRLEVTELRDHDVIKSIMQQDCGNEHRLYVSAIADTLPCHIRDNAAVAEKLRKWDALPDPNGWRSMYQNGAALRSGDAV